MSLKRYYSRVMTDLLDQRGVPASNVDASERVADNPAVAAGSGADNRFRTHQVANQVPPLDGYDPLACDPAVADALTREGAAAALPALSATAAIVCRVSPTRCPSSACAMEIIRAGTSSNPISNRKSAMSSLTLQLLNP